MIQRVNGLPLETRNVTYEVSGRNVREAYNELRAIIENLYTSCYYITQVRKKRGSNFTAFIVDFQNSGVKDRHK